MPAMTMDDGEFRQALGAFEGMLRSRSGDLNQDVARKESIARVEMMFPGFGDAYASYLDESRNSVERIRVGTMIREDGGRSDWYSGAKTSIGEWPSYRTRLEAGLPEAAVTAIHNSTERILHRSANPKAVGDRRKGLVIGYVQSGKTANFTGLIAKAVDEGYRIIIVLAGMYSNLRAQTQIRLEKDLGLDDLREKSGLALYRLTGADADMGSNVKPDLLSSTGNVAIMVVKKHEKRLANVTKFLESIPDEILTHRAVMIIDDESDQATPNTLGDKETVSTINQRIRDLWAAVKTGTYVAYTATPFANVFIDPSSPKDLYPSDFIAVLPKPDSYMGSELFFDVHQTFGGAEDEMIHRLAHEVPGDEAAIYTPKPRGIDDFAPVMTPSLEKAIRWFVLATAIRKLRKGREQDSSMLVHTSQLVKVHELTKEVIAGFISEIALDVDNQESAFRAVFDDEIDNAAPLRGGQSVPEWGQLWPVAAEILANVVVKIDNGRSDDRLIYVPGKPQTVIAVGGGTLSRGLTLEGLVVSYFLRSSNTYDTLLQMGRWFGFRPGYADLVRVWMGPGLLDEYAHLASVERQLRDEVEEMEKEERTPREFAIKVRSHPGRLEITGKNKMTAAQLVRAGLGGTRRQTIYLDRSSAGRSRAYRAASALVRRAQERDLPVYSRGAHLSRRLPTKMFRGLSNDDLVSFLEDYWVAPTDQWLQADGMREWLARHGSGTTWNLILVSGSGGSTGSFEYADGVSVETSRRAPLKPELWTQDRLGDDLPAGADIVNIRALMAGDDYLLDLRILADRGELSEEDIELLDGVDRKSASAVKAARALIRPNEGTILLYAVDGDSQPAQNTTTRAAMDAEGPLIGLGVIFPHAEAEDPGEYWAVPLETQDAENESPAPTDDEGDYVPQEIE